MSLLHVNPSTSKSERNRSHHRGLQSDTPWPLSPPDLFPTLHRTYTIPHTGLLAVLPVVQTHSSLPSAWNALPPGVHRAQMLLLLSSTLTILPQIAPCHTALPAHSSQSAAFFHSTNYLLELIIIYLLLTFSFFFFSAYSLPLLEYKLHKEFLFAYLLVFVISSILCWMPKSKKNVWNITDV